MLEGFAEVFEKGWLFDIRRLVSDKCSYGLESNRVFGYILASPFPFPRWLLSFQPFSQTGSFVGQRISRDDGERERGSELRAGGWVSLGKTCSPHSRRNLK